MTRTVGYIIRDLTPEGDEGYLAKCHRCAWAATFSRPTLASAEADMTRHQASCRGTNTTRRPT